MVRKTLLLELLWVLVPFIQCASIPTKTFKCFRDICDRGYQYCDPEPSHERCYWCKDRWAECGKVSMPRECDAYCVELNLNNLKEQYDTKLFNITQDLNRTFSQVREFEKQKLHLEEAMRNVTRELQLERQRAEKLEEIRESQAADLTSLQTQSRGWQAGFIVLLVLGLLFAILVLVWLWKGRRKEGNKRRKERDDDSDNSPTPMSSSESFLSQKTVRDKQSVNSSEIKALIVDENQLKACKVPDAEICRRDSEGHGEDGGEFSEVKEDGLIGGKDNPSLLLECSPSEVGNWSKESIQDIEYGSNQTPIEHKTGKRVTPDCLKTVSPTDGTNNDRSKVVVSGQNAIYSHT